MPDELDQDELPKRSSSASIPASTTIRRLMRTSHRTRAASCARRPFGGPGGAVLRHFGFGRFPGNPADLPELHLRVPQEGHDRSGDPDHAPVRRHPRLDGARRAAHADGVPRLPGALLRLGSKAILEHSGLVDKLVGDEIIGLFFGGVSGPDHAPRGSRRGHGPRWPAPGARDATPQGPILVGGALHTGTAYVGPTGPAELVDDFTALGDVVNTTARLASAAAAGELLVSADRGGGRRARWRPTRSAGRWRCAAARRRSTSSSCGRRVDRLVARVRALRAWAARRGTSSRRSRPARRSTSRRHPRTR